MPARYQVFIVVAVVAVTVAGAVAQPTLTPLEELGKRLYFDTNLSSPAGQSCATCHAPEVGFTGPDSDINATQSVYPGALDTRFGNRRPPTAAYAGESPILYYDEADDVWVGGIFWDGRATGWTLGDPLAEQALGPFLNPLEQNNPSAKSVVQKVAKSNYATLFEMVWGRGSLDLKNIDATYELIGRAISAFEKSIEVNPFTSKYDYYLKGEVRLTRQERRGLRLFEGKAMCSACHPSELGPNGEPPLFTDFTYDNLGVPRNPNNPFYMAQSRFNPLGYDWVDLGLGGFLLRTEFADQAADNYGKHKVPTLRNADKRPNPSFVKSFAHNGFFTSLEEIVHFYNTRDVESWPPPEVADNVNTDELGDLGLSAEEEADLVAFLRTLSDGYVVPADKAGLRADDTIERPGLEVVGPNPFNPQTRFAFYIPTAGDVQIVVFDISGRRVDTLVDGWHAAGTHEVDWSAAGLPSGSYFVQMRANQVASTRQVTILK